MIYTYYRFVEPSFVDHDFVKYCEQHEKCTGNSLEKMCEGNDVKCYCEKCMELRKKWIDTFYIEKNDVDFEVDYYLNRRFDAYYTSHPYFSISILTYNDILDMMKMCAGEYQNKDYVDYKTMEMLKMYCKFLENVETNITVQYFQEKL